MSGISVVLLTARDEAMAAEVAEALIIACLWFECNERWVFRVDRDDLPAAEAAIRE
jgi:hypothetical protein